MFHVKHAPRECRSSRGGSCSLRPTAGDFRGNEPDRRTHRGRSFSDCVTRNLAPNPDTTGTCASLDERRNEERPEDLECHSLRACSWATLCRSFSACSVLSTVRRCTSFPFAYFLTFTCHGAHLHGDPSGSVDRLHNQYGSPLSDPSRELHASMVRKMGIEPYSLSRPGRQCVLKAILETCLQHRWLPWTVHVRKTHVHAVISAARAGVTVRRAVKACATRGLHCSGLDRSRQRKWTRKGSVVHLWNQARLEAAIVYVVREQGEPMELFVHPHASRFICET